MNLRMALYRNNPILQWLWKHGWEEPVGPLGPLAERADHAVHAPDFSPHPEPWREAVPLLIQAAQARELASRMEGRLKDQAIKSATSAIELVLDDWCGTPPRKWPWPWPGPPPWTWEIASELSLVAHSLQPGGLKDGLLDIAGQVMQKAAGGR
jgi:hypothetical protein